MAGTDNFDNIKQEYGHQDEAEVVEFHSEMPQVPDEDVTFTPDDELEEQIEEQS